MMASDLTELILGLGLIVVSAINAITVIYTVRQFASSRSPRQTVSEPDEASNHQNQRRSSEPEETTESAEVASVEIEVEETQSTEPQISSETAVQAAPTERPTTKTEILAWRNRIIEELERELRHESDDDDSQKGTLDCR